MEEKVRLEKSTIDNIITLNRHCKEIVDYIMILQTLTSVSEKVIFEKTFSRIQEHFDELKKLKKPELKYKK
jgi:predicted esterase YcpF (UPF0227 family)